MFKKIATLVGFMKAPRKTFLLRNPKKGAKALLAVKGAKAAMKSPVAAAVGAAVAVPLTVMAIRKFGEND